MRVMSHSICSVRWERGEVLETCYRGAGVDLCDDGEYHRKEVMCVGGRGRAHDFGRGVFGIAEERCLDLKKYSKESGDM